MIRATFITLLSIAECTLSSVNTSSGFLSGVTTSLGTEFLGIKYGVAERFAPSHLVTADVNVSATSLPPYCPQSGMSNINEDCLYLNVYLPSGNLSQLPVMVWVHGGSFQEGGSADPTFNGSLLAHEENVIVVTLNYRLGTLGFYTVGVTSYTPAITDVVTALNWVQRNIAAFGGDPSSVTLFGESSGATLIRALSTSQALTGLFSKVILESDPQLGYEISVDQALKSSSYVLLVNNCSSTSCLSKKTLPEILHGDGILPLVGQLWPDHTTFFNPWIDHHFVTGRFSDLASGRKIPERSFLLGTVKNESAAVLAPLAEAAVARLLPENITEIVLAQALGNNTSLIEAIISTPALVPSSNDSSELSKVIELSILTTKLEFECPTAFNAYQLRLSGNPVYLFRFDKGIRYSANEGSPLCSDSAEVCHEDDLNAVFGNKDPSSQLGSFTRKAWADFAKSGAPGWTLLDVNDERAYSIGTDMYVSVGESDPVCDALYKLGVYS